MHKIFLMLGELNDRVAEFFDSHPVLVPVGSVVIMVLLAAVFAD